MIVPVKVSSALVPWVLCLCVLVRAGCGSRVRTLLSLCVISAKGACECAVQNVLDTCVGSLVWWAWGHSLAFGENGLLPNEFIGGTVSNPFPRRFRGGFSVLTHAQCVVSEWT